MASKTVVLRELAGLGRAVHAHSARTTFAIHKACFITVEELVTALTRAGVVTCLLCLYGQKAPLIRFLAQLVSIHAAGDGAIELDLAVNTLYDSDTAPLASLVRVPAGTKPADIDLATVEVKPSRVGQVTGKHGKVGKVVAAVVGRADSGDC